MHQLFRDVFSCLLPWTMRTSTPSASSSQIPTSRLSSMASHPKNQKFTRKDYESKSNYMKYFMLNISFHFNFSLMNSKTKQKIKHTHPDCNKNRWKFIKEKILRSFFLVKNLFSLSRSWFLPFFLESYFLIFFIFFS